MALEDTIDGLLERQRLRTAPPMSGADLLTDWVKDVEGVMSAVTSVLSTYVAAGKAKVDPISLGISEEAVGTYSAPGLLISIADREITVAPVARVTFMGAGRIDMFRSNRTSEADRLFIIRPREETDESRAAWLIEMKGRPAPIALGVAPYIQRGTRYFVTLEPASIESALEHLLELD